MAHYSSISGQGRGSSEQDAKDTANHERASNSTAATTAARTAFSQSSAVERENRRQRSDGATYDMRNMNAALPSIRKSNDGPRSSSGDVPKELQRKPLPSIPTENYSTADTTVYEQQAPAITHETIYENVHEHQQQHITREIHEHHYYHRVLPVHDVEVLPSVHYVSDERGLRQMAENEMPVRNSREAQRQLEEGFKKLLPKSETTPGRRQFSARQFDGVEGEKKETTAEDGVERSETWWVHPPTLATGAKDSGQTKPFHFDSDKR